VASDPAKKSAFLAFAQGAALTSAYVESEGFLGGDATPLAAFVADAGAQGVSTELLFGYAPWARTAEHAKAIALAQKAVTFASGLATTKPVAVHFDVEPHGLAEWGTDQASIANQYVDLLEELFAVTNGSGLALVVDIPFWYDAIAVTRKGTTRPLMEWVVDAVDRVAIMDYRDHADGADGIIALGAAEVTYGASVNKPVVLGVETLCNLDPPKVSFCEEGRAALESALATTAASYGQSPGFFGFAIHDYAAFAALKP